MSIGGLISKKLNQQKKNNLLRTLSCFSSNQIDFFSNDYLGRASKKRLQEKNRLDENILYKGSTGSRLLSGNSSFSEKLESQIATFHHAPASLLYGTGYLANIGLLSSLFVREVACIIDEQVHASIKDGLRLGFGKKRTFRHNDPNDLESKLKEEQENKIVIIESLYSMTGDMAPLKDIFFLCEKYKTQLIVDEAHAVGIYGKNGMGLSEQYADHPNLLARVVTYGKAFGSYGASCLCGISLKTYQINFSRPFVYTTAPPLYQLYSIEKAYNEMPSLREERKKLQQNITYFCSKSAQEHYETSKNDSPIQYLKVSDEIKVLEISSFLSKNAINSLAIRSPTVRKGEERIRISLHSFNTFGEIDLFFDTVNNFYKHKK